MNKNCQQCGQSFAKKLNESKAYWASRRFCSQACGNISRRNWRECPNCHERWTGKAQKYCSKQCAGLNTGFKVGDKAPETAFKKGDARCVGNTNAAGHIPWNKGIIWHELRGANHPNWKGGMPKTNRRETLSYTDYRKYLDWQKTVFKRDNWECQDCGKHGGVLHADHVKPWILHPELRFEVPNGRTLCPPCHRKTSTYGRTKNSYKLLVTAL